MVERTYEAAELKPFMARLKQFCVDFTEIVGESVTTLHVRYARGKGIVAKYTFK